MINLGLILFAVASFFVRLVSAVALEPKFTQENVEAFVALQFATYFGFCPGFVMTFADSLLFCDSGTNCLTNRPDLLDMCQETEGTVNEIHSNLTVLPSSFSYPFYSQIAIVGKQTVCLEMETMYPCQSALASSLQNP